MCFLYSIFSKKNKEKGFSLLELLLVISILTIFGSSIGDYVFKTLQGARLTSTVLSHVELRETVNRVLADTNSCKANLKPTAGGIDSTTGVGDITALKKGSRIVVPTGLFKNDLDIVKIELEYPVRLDSSGNPVLDTTTGNPVLDSSGDPKSADVDRELKIYFKRKRVGSYSTKGSGICSNTVTTGCYEVTCKLAYKIKSDGTAVEKCDPEDCSGHIPSGGGGVSDECYVVTDSANGRKTLVGCGTTKNNSDGTTAFGHNAGQAGGGTDNTFIGYEAGKTGKGIKNTFVGRGAGKNISTVGGGQKGTQNTFIGAGAGQENTTGANNSFFGVGAGASNTTGYGNMFIGMKAGNKNTTGGGSVFIGIKAGEKNQTVGGGVFIGANAGRQNTTGAYNTFIGKNAGRANFTGDQNTFIGAGAGASHNVLKKTGTPTEIENKSGSTFIGANAGSTNTTGEHNTFIGANAGKANTTASYNNFVGKNAGAKNTTGTRNAFFGDNAGANQVTCNNTEAGSGGTKYCQNTFFGHYTGHNMNGGTTGGYRNVFFGAAAGYKATTANSNTFMGANAGKCTTGNGNLFLGSGAGHGPKEGCSDSGNNPISTGSNNIFIGKEAGLAGKGGVSATGSLQLNIGNLIFGRMPSSAPNPPTATPPGPDFFPDAGTGTNKYLKDGDDQEDGLVINGNLYVKGKAFANCGTNGTCQETSISLGTPSSSKIHKKNITPFVEFEKSLIDITTTPLFTYEYKDDHPNHKRMGIIAEDLPPHLQIKDQYEPVKPDWVSIYGTFWASIKALFNKVTNLTKSILRLNSITSSLKVNLYEVKEKLEDLHGVKDRLEVLEKETQFLRKQNKELKKKIKALSKKGVSQ